MKRFTASVLTCMFLIAPGTGCQDEQAEQRAAEQAQYRETMQLLDEAQRGFVSPREEPAVAEQLRSIDEVEQHLDLASRRQAKQLAAAEKLEAQLQTGPPSQRRDVARSLAGIHLSAARSKALEARTAGTKLLALGAIDSEEVIHSQDSRLLDQLRAIQQYDAAAARYGIAGEQGLRSLIDELEAKVRSDRGRLSDLQRERDELARMISQVEAEKQAELTEQREAAKRSLAHEEQAFGKEGFESFIWLPESQVMDLLNLSQQQLDERVAEKELRARGSGANREIFVDQMAVSIALQRKADKAANDAALLDVKLAKLTSEKEILDRQIELLSESIRNIESQISEIRQRRDGDMAARDEQLAQKAQMVRSVAERFDELNAKFQAEAEAPYREADDHASRALELLGQAKELGSDSFVEKSVMYSQLVAALDQARLRAGHAMLTGWLAERLSYLAQRAVKLDFADVRGFEKQAQVVMERHQELVSAAADSADAASGFAGAILAENPSDELAARVRALKDQLTELDEAIDAERAYHQQLTARPR